MHACTGELSADFYILVRGDVHVMDVDRKTPLFKIPEGTIFGEATVIKRIDVSAGPCGAFPVCFSAQFWCLHSCMELRALSRAAPGLVNLSQQRSRSEGARSLAPPETSSIQSGSASGSERRCS